MHFKFFFLFLKKLSFGNVDECLVRKKLATHTIFQNMVYGKISVWLSYNSSFKPRPIRKVRNIKY